MKRSQLIMIWLLPVIVIGGLFYPILGYLVIAMMSSLLLLSYFKKGRFWCWNLCPRGAFLDIVLLKFSAKKPVPKIFTKKWFRWLIFAIFISFLTFRIILTGGNLIAVGAVFVRICLVTTIIAIVLGVLMKQRAWCMICPMGTLQEKIGKIAQRRRP
ncbi:MAG: 4Fe-4S binding protein [Candidatus Omnitrophica bacterium]|nr:4Fe-4S binding protein [Candidatus Omnitrophota bacterium]